MEVKPTKLHTSKDIRNKQYLFVEKLSEDTHVNHSTKTTEQLYAVIIIISTTITTSIQVNH